MTVRLAQGLHSVAPHDVELARLLRGEILAALRRLALRALLSNLHLAGC